MFRLFFNIFHQYLVDIGQYLSNIYYILHITYYTLSIDCLLIAYRLPLMPISSAIIDMGPGPGPPLRQRRWPTANRAAQGPPAAAAAETGSQ